MKTTVNISTDYGYDLSGVLHRPDTAPIRAYGVFAHCFSCTKSIKAAVVISEYLAQAGIATLRFDFGGLGRSGGEFADTNFSTNIKDVVSVAHFLKDNYEAPQILVGHSLGGTTVLEASKQLDFVQAVVTIGAPSSAEHILKTLQDHLATLKVDGHATIPLAGRPHEFKQQFVDDVRHHSGNYNGLGKALLVMHAPLDNSVSVDEATKIFIQAKHPKSFVSLDNADHLLTRDDDALYAANVIVGWSQRYLRDAATARPNRVETGVSAIGETQNGFLTQINTPDHEFIMDEPRALGGTNLGPTPYDLLAAALGGCTTMTLNNYARLKKLDVQSVQTDVTHDRIHAEDCETCEKAQGKIDQFSRIITITGNLTDAQRKRMLEIADRCPVHRTLENEIIVKTTLR